MKLNFDSKSGFVNPLANINRRSFITGIGGAALMLGMGKSGQAASSQYVPSADTEIKIKQALSHLQSGYHCSQCVFNAFAPNFNINSKTALKMSSALAGGSIVGGECGAISSGYLILGLRYGADAPSLEPGEAHQQMIQMFSKIGQYVSRFKEKYQAITCLELTGVNVFDPTERQKGREQGAFEDCGHIVADAIQMLDSML